MFEKKQTFGEQMSKPCLIFNDVVSFYWHVGF